MYVPLATAAHEPSGHDPTPAHSYTQLSGSFGDNPSDSHAKWGGLAAAWHGSQCACPSVVKRLKYPGAHRKYGAQFPLGWVNVLRITIRVGSAAKGHGVSVG
jgi:hypothetical protein